MDNKLPYVVSDLDGTLVSIGYQIKPDTVRDVLKYQKASGNKFTFATGRSDFMCYPIIEKLDIKNPVISCNGAIIRDLKTNKVLYAEYLNKDTIIDCFKRADKLSLDITGYDEESVILLKSSNQYKVLTDMNNEISNKDWYVPFKIYPDYQSIIKDVEDGKLHMLKMMIDCNLTGTEKEALSVFEAHQDELTFTWSGNNYLDAMKKGISKGTGLVHLAKILNVDVEDICTFGDNYNDIPMIDEVKHGYAIGNGVQPLKDIAYKTCDTLENNGVGKILIDIINNKY